ncbi:MAG: hypothetical protein P9X24_14455 [Candidatus Hatepunaea meridiana]|nr:hypothetical protein [Candidatus Hatepunaea meridiana]
MQLLNKLILYLTTFTLIICFSFQGNLYAAQPGRQAGGFLRLGLGADRVAMGDCGVALVGADMNWYYNPAGLPFQKMRQASFSYRFMSLDRKIMYAGYSMPLEPRAGLAIGILRAGTDDIDMRDSNGNHIDWLSHSENLIHGSFAVQPHPKVALGLSIKWLINAVPNILDNDKNLYAYGMSVDLGAQVVVLPNLKLGLQIRDLGATYSWETSEVWGDELGATEDNLPILIRCGAAWDPLPIITVASDIIIDPERAGDDSDAIEPHFGIEYRQPPFTLRTGSNGKTFTFGFGLELNLKIGKARMDYAVYLEDISPDDAHLVSWVIEF